MGFNRLHRFVGVAALVLTGATANAQTFTSNDPVLRRIWEIGMKQSKTYDLAQVLLDSIGPRLTGSPGMKSASDWVIKTYKSWGVDAKAENYGTWRGWQRGYTHIDLLQPRIRTLEGTMQPFSPGTGGKDVVGAVVLLPIVKDSVEFLRWLPSVKGKFVLMSPPRSTCRPTSQWEEFATPDEIARRDSTNDALAAAFNARQSSAGFPGGGRGGRGAGGTPALSMNDRLDRAGAAAFITTTAAADAWGTYTVLSQTRTKTAASITLSCEDYTLLFRLTERNQGAVVRLNAESKFLGEAPAFNTIATVPGSSKAGEYVMLSSHFDSWDAGSGATDNGTGTIVMMEAMRILRQVYPNPKRTIISGHWNGEEQGLNGSRAYAADHPNVVEKLHALFNQDNGTGRVQSTSGVGMIDGAKHMQQWLSQLPLEFQQQLRYTGVGNPSTGGTDNASFGCYGTPAFGLSSISWDYNPYTHHTNRDTFDKIVFDQLKGNATITAMLVYLASEDPNFITRERRNLNEPDASAAGRGGRGGGGRGGRGAAAAGDEVTGRMTKSGDSTTVTFTFTVSKPADTTVAAGRGGRGGGRGGAAGRGGGAGGGDNTPRDALGWATNCSKGTRADQQ